jgi:multidrug efflux pump subunit AcrA (membrane-fusion protein)
MKKYRALTQVPVESHIPKFARYLCWFLGFWLVSLVVTPWVQTSMGTGKVIAFAPNERMQQIGATVDGRVSKWYVVEGQRVQSGDPLVEISDLDPQIMEKLGRERQAAKSRLEAAESALKTSQINVGRQRELADQGLSAERSYELAKIEYQKFQSDVASAKAEFARIDLRLSRQGSQVLTAPRDGSIFRILAPEGGPVIKTGDVLAQLVPDTQMRAVELWIDGNDMPLIHEGQEVRLQFEGWPAVQFAGWPSVAVGTFGGKVGSVDSAGSDTGKFRILVFPEGGEYHWPAVQYLRQGVRVQGWVLLGRVRLGFELWRKINGFPASVEAPESSMMQKKGNK